MRSAIEIPDPLPDAARRAATAAGTSVMSTEDQAVRNLIRDRVIARDAARDPLDQVVARGERPYGRMQEVFESYLMEGLVDADGH